MAGETKERIAARALALFARRGYLGTSMRDIAEGLGITKGALYRHYTGKQEILADIIARMERADTERAGAYAMPLSRPDKQAEEYLHTPPEQIRRYSKAQFLHWTEEPFSADFRRMLTLEQYRDPEMARLYQDYLSTGPLRYMTAVFRPMTDSDAAARQLALDFYGPMFLLYSAYDAAQDKAEVIDALERHVDRFIETMQK